MPELFHDLSLRPVRIVNKRISTKESATVISLLTRLTDLTRGLSTARATTRHCNHLQIRMYKTTKR